MPLIIKNYDPEIADTPKETLGLDEILSNLMDYVEEITEVVGFRDNITIPDLPIDAHSWGLGELIWYGYDVGVSEWETGFFETRSIGDYRILQYTIFNLVAFNDSLQEILLLKNFNDSETVCWNRLNFWNNNTEFDGSNLIDVGEPANLVEFVQLQDTLICFLFLDGSETDCWNTAYLWDNNYIFS